MDLQKIRDSIDGKILSLLTERMELALRTAKLKAAIRDKAREAWVLERAERYSRNHNHLVQGDFVHSLFDEIILRPLQLHKVSCSREGRANGARRQVRLFPFSRQRDRTGPRGARNIRPGRDGFDPDRVHPRRSESRPSVFLFDVQSRNVRDSVEPVLGAIRRKRRTFRFLGFFKEEVCE